ncbi:hypothetical protein CVIRNUC_007152 [Coccomyxa viridis]|uniref:Extracellular protein n=1 Tax=Coccomyxa viridis TaxID=1274662 RepID=A0AAV1ID84_9CHLO|nr:hypothetical protein CVIRNUC_007152 [Coccomyxa viridis]
METTRCFPALVLVLCSTSHAVGGRPTSTVATYPHGVKTPPKHSDQVEDRHLSSSLHSRRLAAAGTPAQPTNDSDSPTWTLPGLDQIATDLGHSLVSATTSLASQPSTTSSGQSSTAAPDTQTPQAANDLELPVATQCTAQWAGVVAKAMTAGGMGHSESLQALQGFRSAVAAKMAKTAETLEKLNKGDIAGFVEEVMNKAVAIKAPTFFSSNTDLFQDSVSAISFGFTGVGVSPCAIAVNPVGIGIGATGINIAPQGVSIAPTGLNVAPQGASIGPTLIAIGPYDTTVAPQGLNIAPALISISPVKTVINPTGPLKVGGSVVKDTVPALPSPPEAAPSSQG